MASVTKLKTKPRSKGKGEPPSVGVTNENLRTPIKKGKIEFSVPEAMLDEFSVAAGSRFGFKKGCKSELFIAMWEEYKERLSR